MGGGTQLKKHVEEELRWLAAERAVLRIHDVKALASEIQVLLPNAYDRTDEGIARARTPDHKSQCATLLEKYK